jgi:hypothetical protein
MNRNKMTITQIIKAWETLTERLMPNPTIFPSFLHVERIILIGLLQFRYYRLANIFYQKSSLTFDAAYQVKILGPPLVQEVADVLQILAG